VQPPHAFFLGVWGGVRTPFGRAAINPHQTHHINICFHWLRHHIKNKKNFQLAYVQSDHNFADFLTKPLMPIKTKISLNNIFLKSSQLPV
jgi:hypothetical protein